jgi:pimeloyl-ACP methyl ester carboxylesterase
MNIKKLNLFLLIGLLQSCAFAGAEATTAQKKTISMLMHNDDPREIEKNITKNAKQEFHWLKGLANDLFSTQKLQRPLEIRKSLLNPFGFAGQLYSINRKDEEPIECTFFGNGKKELVVIGTGFGNTREIAAPLIPFFIHNYDVVIFDQRGHGYKEQNFSFKRAFAEWILWQKLPHINPSKTYLGKREDEDVITIVNHFKKEKDYKKVYGVGHCFSGMIFLKAQAKSIKERNPIFDKIILDSCLLSIDSVIEQVTKDPKLLFSPQRGGWEKHWLFGKDWVKQQCKSWLQDIFSHAGDTKELNSATYIKKIRKTPILFIHSKTDLMVPYNDFQKIWNAADSNYKRCALITHNSHLTNHFKNKEIYAYIANRFLKNSFANFKGSLESRTEASFLSSILPCTS